MYREYGFYRFDPKSLPVPCLPYTYSPVRVYSTMMEALTALASHGVPFVEVPGAQYAGPTATAPALCEAGISFFIYGSRLMGLTSAGGTWTIAFPCSDVAGRKRYYDWQSRYFGRWLGADWI